MTSFVARLVALAAGLSLVAASAMASAGGVLPGDSVFQLDLPLTGQDG